MPAMKNTGKPYAGKLHVRIDEGAGGRNLIPSRSTLLCKYTANEYILNSLLLM